MTSVIVVLALIGNAACSSGSEGPTLGTIVGELKQLVKQARTPVDSGNVAVGQQQMLFASTLRSTIEQFESAYSRLLGRSFKELNVAEQNVFNDLLEKQEAKNLRSPNRPTSIRVLSVEEQMQWSPS